MDALRGWSRETAGMPGILDHTYTGGQTSPRNRDLMKGDSKYGDTTILDCKYMDTTVIMGSIRKAVAIGIGGS